MFFNENGAGVRSRPRGSRVAGRPWLGKARVSRRWCGKPLFIHFKDGNIGRPAFCEACGCVGLRGAAPLLPRPHGPNSHGLDGANNYKAPARRADSAAEEISLSRTLD